MTMNYQSLFGNYANSSNFNRPFVVDSRPADLMTRDAQDLAGIDNTEVLGPHTIGDDYSTQGNPNGLGPKQKAFATTHPNSALSPTSNESTVTNMSDTFQLSDETFFKSSYLVTPSNFEAETQLQSSVLSKGLEAEFKFQPSQPFNSSSIDTELPQQEDYNFYRGPSSDRHLRHNSAPSFMQHQQFFNDTEFGATAATTTSNGPNYSHHEEEITSNVSTNSLNQYFATPNSSISSASSSTSTSNALAVGSVMGSNKQVADGNLNAGTSQAPLSTQEPLHITSHTRKHSNTIPIDQLTSLTLRTPSTSLQLGPSRKRSLSCMDQVQQQQLVNLPQPDFNQQLKIEDQSPFSTNASSSLINLDANTIAFSAATAAAVCADSIADFDMPFTGYDNKGSFDQQQGTINPRQLFTTKLATSLSSPSLSSMFGLKRGSLQHLQRSNNNMPIQLQSQEPLMLPNGPQGMPSMNQLEHSAFSPLHNRSLSTSYVDSKTNGDRHRVGDWLSSAGEDSGVDLVGADLELPGSFKTTNTNRSNGGSNGAIVKNRSYSHTNGMHSSRSNTRRNSWQTSSKGKQYAGASPQQQSHFARAVSQQLDELKEQQLSGEKQEQYQQQQQQFTGNIASLQLSPTTISPTIGEIKEEPNDSTQPAQQKKKRRKSSVSKGSIQAQQLLIKEQLDKQLETQHQHGLLNNKPSSKSVSPTNPNQVDTNVHTQNVTKLNKKGGNAFTKNDTKTLSNLQELDPKGLLSAPVVQNENGCFPCSECDKQFKRTEHLKRHIRSVHSNIRPYHCHYCERKFSRLDNLAQHIKTHYKVDGSGNTNIVYGDMTIHSRRDKKKKKKQGTA